MNARKCPFTARRRHPYISTVEVHFREHVEAKLVRIASKRGRNAEAFVRKAVERAVNYDEWFLRAVEQDIAAIERGQPGK